MITINTLRLKKQRVSAPFDTILSNQDAYRFALQMWDRDSLEIYESFYIVCLNAKNKVVGWSLIGIGGTSQCPVDVKKILCHALLSGCTAIIAFHNHPSGNPTPSDSDILTTKQIDDGCKAVGLQLLDHIIVCRKDFYSFKNNE